MVLSAAIGGIVLFIVFNNRDTRKLDRRQSTFVAPESILQSGILDDKAPIIGVSVDGEHRAYALKSLMQPDTHVVNDFVGSKPVTVTFCDVDDCVQVFTAPNQSQPLEIKVGGSNRLRPTKMLLKIGSNYFWQDTLKPLGDDPPIFPFATIDYVRTTWGKWREAHPNSDLFIR
jgi:hypothetical protein